MWEDTIVSEVQKIRKEIETECGNDPDRIFERALERQKKYIMDKDAICSDLKEKEKNCGHPLVSFPPKRRPPRSKHGSVIFANPDT